MGLDLHSTAKRAFLDTFESAILKPRQLPHRVQFTGPTGTNAVEAAMKLARKVTGIDTAALLARILDDPSSGIGAPAAILLETVQGEGGLNAASVGWVQRIASLARQHGALLIVEDVQAGCGRTGSFFSFEPMGIVPDLVAMSKSLSGYGLPMAVVLVLVHPDHDQWLPAEHNGTFRGNTHAFVSMPTWSAWPARCPARRSRGAGPGAEGAGTAEHAAAATGAGAGDPAGRAHRRTLHRDAPRRLNRWISTTTCAGSPATGCAACSACRATPGGWGRCRCRGCAWTGWPATSPPND
jgi:hypothetical protein